MSAKIPYSTREQILFFRRLGLYTNSGMTLLSGLSSLKEQSPKKSHRELLTVLQDCVRNGQPLSVGLGQFPHLFDGLTCGFVEAGEQSGSLAKAFEYLASSLEKRQALQQKALSACAYPLIILVATFGVSVFLILYIFPRIVPILQGFNTALPFPTRALLFIQHAAVAYWMPLGICALALSIGGVFLYRKPWVRKSAEKCLLNTPVAGKLYQNYILAALFHTLATLFEGGIQIVPAIVLIQKIYAHSIYASALHYAELKILAGQPLSQSLRAYPRLFPISTVQLLEVGENTGTLRESLQAISAIYASDLEDSIRNISILIEPALMMVMGVVVGFIALAIITPMYQITSSLSTH
jgi:type II secretory pathway component PulF